MKYVLGFMVDEELEYVALIKKTKPPELAGRMNGIGGKVEPGEANQAAMIREFKEETGVDHDYWLYAGRVDLCESEEEIFVYITRTDKVFDVETLEAEEVSIRTIKSVMDGDLVIGPHVKNLLSMSLSCFAHTKRVPFDLYVI